MAVSQNGWDLVNSNQLDRSPIPGTDIVPVPGVLAGDVATVLHWVGVQFNAKVEKLYNPGCWGWNAPTPIPGSSIYSNHSSGTAIDFNAPSFPWKQRTMSAAQRQACRDIAAQTGGLVVWGGDYSTYVDEMHFEIDATDAELAQLVNKLKGDNMQDISLEIGRILYAFAGYDGIRAKPNALAGEMDGEITRATKGQKLSGDYIRSLYQSQAFKDAQKTLGGINAEAMARRAEGSKPTGFKPITKQLYEKE